MEILCTYSLIFHFSIKKNRFYLHMERKIENETRSICVFFSSRIYFLQVNIRHTFETDSILNVYTTANIQQKSVMNI